MIFKYEDINLVQRINGILILNPNEESQSVPDAKGNREYDWCLKWSTENGEIEEITSEVLPSAKQIRDEALSNITWTRSSDGAVVQIRHPDYATDYLVMERVRDKLANGESRAWIDINNNPITMSKEDMTECLEHGEDEIDRIFAEYILTL